MLKSSNAPSPHEGVFAMKGGKLACVRSGRWKLHVVNPGSSDMRQLSDEEAVNWIDPRAPNGVSILAPFEQAKAYELPGLMSGDPPRPMMLFNLETDPGEQHDVADEFPEVVKRLKALFDQTNAQVREFPKPKLDYLFRDPAPGESRPLMHLIGGELRYDRIPAYQRELLKDQ